MQCGGCRSLSSRGDQQLSREIGRSLGRGLPALLEFPTCMRGLEHHVLKGLYQRRFSEWSLPPTPRRTSATTEIDVGFEE